MRALAALSSGWWSAGACTTTILSLVSAPREDPQFRLRHEQLLCFAQLWHGLSHKQRYGVSRAWDKIATVFGQIPPSNRWRRVRGPIAATIAVIMDLSWRPRSPVFWTHCGDSSCILRITDAAFPHECWSALNVTCSRISWSKASLHYQGEGVQEGVDFTVLHRVLKKKSQDGEPEAAGMLRNMASAAFWTEKRLADAGYASGTSGLCPRCGACDETPLHRFWSCPCNSEVPDRIVSQTDCYRECAEGEEHLACLWTRGLMPLPISTGHLPPPVDRSWNWGRLVDQERVHGGTWGIDGSGGEHAKDWRLRRCGWSIVRRGADGGFDSLAFGTLPTLKQSSPRAELYAFLQLLRRSYGDVTVYSDCAIVTKGFRKPLSALSKSSMLDLWGSCS